MYCSELRSGVCRGGAGTPEIVRQTVATALVEGHNLMGQSPLPTPNPRTEIKRDKLRYVRFVIIAWVLSLCRPGGGEVCGGPGHPESQGGGHWNGHRARSFFYFSLSNCNVSHILNNAIPFSTVFRNYFFASHRLRVQPFWDCWLVCAQSYGAWINRKSSSVSWVNKMNYRYQSSYKTRFVCRAKNPIEDYIYSENSIHFKRAENTV